MSDFGYRKGGWRQKYLLFKVCLDCGGNGGVPANSARGAGDCYVYEEAECPTCNGVGGTPVNPDNIYFVLCLNKDPHARQAMITYAESIAKENPELCRDIILKLADTYRQFLLAHGEEESNA